jgi:hypothetical protein
MDMMTHPMYDGKRKMVPGACTDGLSTRYLDMRYLEALPEPQKIEASRPQNHRIRLNNLPYRESIGFFSRFFRGHYFQTTAMRSNSAAKCFSKFQNSKIEKNGGKFKFSKEILKN